MNLVQYLLNFLNLVKYCSDVRAGVDLLLKYKFVFNDVLYYTCILSIDFNIIVKFAMILNVCHVSVTSTVDE